VTHPVRQNQRGYSVLPMVWGCPQPSTGRAPGNLSRTLKTMSHYRMVDLKREKDHVRPVARATKFRILAA